MGVWVVRMVLACWSAAAGALQLHAGARGGSCLLGGLLGLCLSGMVRGQHANDVTALDVSFDQEQLTAWSDEYSCQPNR